MGKSFASPIYSQTGPRFGHELMVSSLMGHLGGTLRFVRQAGATYEFPEAFGTLTAALAASHSGDTIVLLSDLREEVTGSNSLFDITIIGAATRPRHDDKSTWTSTTKQVGTASWRNSTGVTATALCIVKAQGWKFVNVLFDAPTSAACVELQRNASSGTDEEDASHASFYGCRFAGGETGIEITGAQNLFNVRIEDCVFQDLTTGIAGYHMYRWDVRGNRFIDNANHIVSNATESNLIGNVFGLATSTGVGLDSQSSGGNNVVSGNYFHGDFNVLNTGDSTDMWAGNFAEETGGVTDANPTGS